MSTPSNGVPEAELDAPAPATLSPTRPLYWSIRRELWENRSISIVPLVAAAVVFFAFTVHAIVRNHRMRAAPALHATAAPALDAAQQYVAIVTPYSIAATMIMVTALLVGAFYCLDALYAERRDRSILFWKSLPVSDLTAVLAKASIPLVVLPLISFAVCVATQLAMLVLPMKGVPRLFEMWVVMFYGLAVHALWHAPLYGWLLLVSAWARRTPLLWAVLLPLAIGVFERIVFQSAHFGSLMKYRVAGAMGVAFHLAPGSHRVTRLDQLDPLGFLGTPGLWLGLIAAAAFLAATVRLRRRGEPI